MQMRPHRLNTLIGAFEDEELAEAAIQELRAVGFSKSQIGVVSRQIDEDMTSERHSGPRIGSYSGLEALVGFAPGVGPAIAAGVLAVSFWNTAPIGAAGALIDLGLSDEQAQHFENQFRAGHTIVTVAGGTRVDIASSVLNRFNQSSRLVGCAT